MKGPKPTKTLYYEDFQYGSGDIAVISERDMLHLYEAVDSVSRPENLAWEIFSFFKGKYFCKCSRKKNQKGVMHAFKI